MNKLMTRRSQRGYALITAILFLVLLSLIALASFKSGVMESKMGANNGAHAQAFESSETARTVVETLIDSNVFNRGWPSSISGTVATNSFDANVLALIISSATCPTSTPSAGGFTLCKAGTVPRDWWSGNSETVPFNPSQLDLDAVFQQTVSSLPVTGNIYIYKVSTTLAVGAGAAMDAGYLGLGRASSAGGGNIFFYVNANGHDYKTSPQAGVNTSAIFRDVVRN